MIVLTAFAVGAPSSPASAKRVALVVGINQYDNLDAAQQLQKALGDSHVVGKALRSLGYEGTALHSRNHATNRQGPLPASSSRGPRLPSWRKRLGLPLPLP